MFRHCYVILYEFFPALHLNDDFIFSRKARTREAIDWIVSFLPSVVPPMSVCPVQNSRGQVSLAQAGLTCHWAREREQLTPREESPGWPAASVLCG